MLVSILSVRSNEKLGPAVAAAVGNVSPLFAVLGAVIFLHELGHFLGFAHTSSTSDVMFPTIQPGGDLETMEVNLTDLQRLTN